MSSKCQDSIKEETVAATETVSDPGQSPIDGVTMETCVRAQMKGAGFEMWVFVGLRVWKGKSDSDWLVWVLKGV